MRNLLLITLAFLSSCNNLKDAQSHEESSGLNSSLSKSEQNWDKVEIETEKAEFTSNDENLFGKFYNDHIEFHIIDDPDIQLYSAQVSKITLYYIDSILCRKKYELDREISDELAQSYGKLSYKSLNQETDSLAMQMGIVLKSEYGYRFNPYLKKYQLKWKVDDKVVYFQHLEDSLGANDYYIEELKDYRRLFHEVQREML